MKKRLLVSILSILIVGTLVASATFAEFSSTASSTGNTFSAGTLTLAIDGTNTAKWVSPSNWAPGGTVTGQIALTNTGSIDSKHVFWKFTDITNSDPLHSGGTANLLDKVIVTKFYCTYKNTTVSPVTEKDCADCVAYFTAICGDKVAPLTLKELTDFANNAYNIVDSDTDSGDGIILAAGNKKDYTIHFEFQFDPAAGNEYQGTKAGFTMGFNATQNTDLGGATPLK